MSFYKITNKLLTLLALIVVLGNVYGQREADRWYFGYNCGLNFNSGEPELLFDGQASEPFGGVGTICDPIGNLLFYAPLFTIFTSQHTVMENGNDFIEPGSGTQGNLIVPWPESDTLFFVFKTANLGGSMGLYYNIIDISLNNGLGAVIEKDVLLNNAWDAADKVIATMHSNKRDIWIITRKFRDDNFAAFLITPNGINETPTLSLVPDNDGSNLERGFIKLSYNKKHLFSSYWQSMDIEVCHFNDETGEIEFLYNLNIGRNPDGIEFSPDSKFAYISYQTGTSTPVTIKQYNMDYVDDVSLFITTAIDVVTDAENGYALQLATDGKIYCIDDASWSSDPNYFIGAINKPWELGTACQYIPNAINMYPTTTSFSFPNIMMDYLYRFEFEGLCAGTPFQFTSNFNPVPDSIRWFFNDFGSGSNNISYEINPEHIFTSGGIYEVEVDVWYPSGRFEHTSREVEVAYAPSPELGQDTVICQGDTITLNAGNDPGQYLWSTGDLGQNIFSISVTDTGTYWVKITNSEGCSTTDSIHVGWFAKSVFNEVNMVITPASCGVSNGSITGLQVEGTEPFSYNWYDGNGNLIGTDIDLFNLSVGNYYLHVSDGNGCTTISDSYTIIDVGDILITAVVSSPSHCMQDIGSISITATSGSGNSFEYSINNGNSWQTDSIFEDLSAGDYFIRVKDQSGCETVYDNNPVVIENIEGPQVVTVDITYENDYSSDGSINIAAIVNAGDIQYSIDSGNYFQTDNGLFENLTAGTYYCVVQDEFGCDTTFIIELNRIISQIIGAIAGDGYTCIGNATASTLLLNNFTDVSGFHVMLTYDENLITCDGYMQVHPDLEDSLVVSTTTSGEVHINWQGQSPVSFPDNSVMAKLLFTGIDEGLSQVDWVANQGESQFFNENGEQINADFQLGSVIIYTRPEILFMPLTEEICEGDRLWIAPMVNGGTGVTNKQWTGPNNYTSDYDDLFFDEVTSNMAGTYTLTVTDTINCVESESMELIVNHGPTIAFAHYDTLWVEPGYILEAGDSFNNIYLWNTGETTSEIIIDSTGLYDVVVTSPQDCKSTDTVQILWGGEPFYLPTAFTPNGDGLNDKFAAVQKYDYISKFHMSIFNRWGQMIFETSDINSGWDGTYQGSPCMMGAYVYRIVYEEFGQQPMESKVVEGTVMLVR